MKIIKSKFLLFIFMFSASFSHGQTLKVSDLRKAFDHVHPTEHRQLTSKGFKLISETISEDQKKFNFKNSETKEIVELTFTEDGEGGEYLNIFYFLPTEIAYKKFIAALPTYKFNYSKRNSRYQLPTSSYSGENIYPHHLIQKDGKNYYSLEYASYKDKALSGPRPGSRNEIPPPIKDSMIKVHIPES